MKIEALVELRRHQATPSEDVRSIDVMVRRTDAELELNFRLDAKIRHIRLTSAQSPGELWRHTCFEAFVAIQGQAAYHEFNFAPSREWRVHAFRAYRDPAPATNALRPLTIAVTATDERLELDVRILLTDLSAIHSRSPLQVGLSAVIEPHNGSLSYWAIRHSAGKPDFHHADAFALRLEAPESE